jgi:hypothetical protein
VNSGAQEGLAVPALHAAETYFDDHSWVQSHVCSFWEYFFIHFPVLSYATLSTIVVAILVWSTEILYNLQITPTPHAAFTSVKIQTERFLNKRAQLINLYSWLWQPYLILDWLSNLQILMRFIKGTKNLFRQHNYNYLQVQDKNNIRWVVKNIFNNSSYIIFVFKGILSTKIVIFSYPKLLSFSILIFIKWRLTPSYAAKDTIFWQKRPKTIVIRIIVLDDNIPRGWIAHIPDLGNR